MEIVGCEVVETGSPLSFGLLVVHNLVSLRSELNINYEELEKCLWKKYIKSQRKLFLDRLFQREQ